jgi:threonine dehydratase
MQPTSASERGSECRPGATATAALLAGRVKLPAGTRVVSIVSGGNVDPERVLALFAPGAAEARV